MRALASCADALRYQSEVKQTDPIGHASNEDDFDVRGWSLPLGWSCPRHIDTIADICLNNPSATSFPLENSTWPIGESADLSVAGISRDGLGDLGQRRHHPVQTFLTPLGSHRVRTLGPRTLPRSKGLLN